jgi:CheY-like chemotaxis protein
VNGARLTGLAILLVDDDPDNTELLAILLETAGADVRTAADARLALEKLDADAAWRPTLLLLDIGLPGLDGYDLLGAIRQRPGLSAVPAVAVSAYAYEKDKQRAIDVGFRMPISKPYDAVEIIDRLADLLSSG